MNVKYSYDEKCLDLARHFYPMQSIAFLEALAQTIQDCVEGREEIPSEPTPRYQCMVEGCPINHVSKRDVCSTVETTVDPLLEPFNASGPATRTPLWKRDTCHHEGCINPPVDGLRCRVHK